MESKTFLIILVVITIVIITTIPLFLFFFSFAPTGYSLKSTSNLCKIGCENEFVECFDKCANEICNENCKIQRGKCLFYC